MIRILAIIVIGFTLSACRTGSDAPAASQQSAQSEASDTRDYTQQTDAGSNTLSESRPREEPPATAGEGFNKQQASASGPTYMPQPVSPPEAVDPVKYHSVTLEWTIPVQRENGDLLSASDLDGYIIEYANQSEPGTIDQQYVQGGQAASHSLSLLPGSYRFRVIAVDINGLASNPSDWVTADLV
jgi:hypothetical protein